MSTKKSTSALAEIRRTRRYFLLSTAFSNYLIFVVVHKYYKSLYLWIFQASLNRFWSNKRRFCHLKLYVLSNLTLSFSLSHNFFVCVVPSATELNYPFNLQMLYRLSHHAALNTLMHTVNDYRFNRGNNIPVPKQAGYYTPTHPICPTLACKNTLAGTVSQWVCHFLTALFHQRYTGMG